MNAFQVAVREILFRWKTGMMLVSVVAAITALISFFTVYKTGFNREIFRHSRDIGSNVVILPSSVDQVDYHEQGGFSEETMPEQVVRQLIEFKASLNHLIPMLEKKAVVSRGDSSATVRVVGISASIPMPGRPKAPMQKSLGKDALQLGSAVAEKLKVQRDAEATVNIGEEE